MRHLAELNVAVPRFALDDPRMAPFMDNLVRINGLAARMPGFVWMHRDDTGHAMHQPTPWSGMAANLSVWETPRDLEHFVHQTVHKRFMARRAEWFEAMRSRHFVMWWVDAGHRPDLGEAKARLDHLEAHGDTDHAFTWSHLPQAGTLEAQRCG